MRAFVSEPKKPKEITVNVDDWLTQRAPVPGGHGLAYPGSAYAHPDQIHLPANASPEERERVRELQEELREKWHVREEVAERAHLLDNTLRDCVECSVPRQHYQNDYICYRCRDAKGGPREEKDSMAD